MVFEKNHSTEHAILEVVDQISSDLGKGNTPIALFLDLSKAFDTLNHDIFISKLKYYGINNSTLDWFKSYLYNRRQFVDINHTKSETTFTSIGIPQGSILGPLLFIIYVNDIQKSSSFYKFIKYADDTTLVNSSTNPDVEIHNVELNKVFNWLCDNRLSLNINKTKFILFHNKN